MSGALDPRVERGMAAQLEARRARIRSGERPLGWKLGFGAPAALQKFQLTAPLVGYLMESALIGSGGTCSLAGWSNPMFEPEVAVHMGRDLLGGASRDEAEAAIARTDDPQALTGELVGLIAHTAQLLASVGGRLEAGEVVITGSTVPPIPADPGTGVEHELDPVGSVRLRFSA